MLILNLDDHEIYPLQQIFKKSDLKTATQGRIADRILKEIAKHNKWKHLGDHPMTQSIMKMTDGCDCLYHYNEEYEPVKLVAEKGDPRIRLMLDKQTLGVVNQIEKIDPITVHDGVFDLVIQTSGGRTYELLCKYRA